MREASSRALSTGRRLRRCRCLPPPVARWRLEPVSFRRPGEAECSANVWFSSIEMRRLPGIARAAGPAMKSKNPRKPGFQGLEIGCGGRI